MRERLGKNILLLMIIVTSFAYRFLLMSWNTFPPGADIGLHESVIKSITVDKTDFFWNYYHMGGGFSVTNPGYHIFVSYVIAMTGAPDYLAQSLVVSLFSTITVLCAFLIVRRVWNESASFIVAFLAAFSGGDISILNWAGYPNIITLTLIPTVFYMYLQRDRLSSRTYLATALLLIGVMFLTHIFSALVFAAIATLALFLSAIFFKRTKLSKSKAISWLMPILLGILLVSPYLVKIVPVYFSPESAITGINSAMKMAILATRTIPFEIVFLLCIPAFLFFLISKFYRGEFLTIPVLLFGTWILVPAVMTQSVLFGLYLDYERYLYFLYFPVIVCVGLLIHIGANILSRIVHRSGSLIEARVTQVNWKYRMPENVSLSRKVACSLFVLGLLFLSLFYIPIFKAPPAGLAEANYYQVMTPTGYEAVQWIRTNTPVNSVFVADANYGWWLSGFAQRPTLSAVDPQYLILAREFEPAKVATNLLKTDYIIDNGLVQVMIDGSKLQCNGFQLSAKLDDSFVSHSFLGVNDNNVSFVYRENDAIQHLGLAQFSKSDIQVRNDSQQASIQISREHRLFNFTEEITVYRGVKFAEISINLQSNAEDIFLDWLHIPLILKGIPMQYDSSYAMLDGSVSGFTQIVLPETELGTNVLLQENPDFFELVYHLGGKSIVQTSFFGGFCQDQIVAKSNETDYLQNLVRSNSKTYLEKTSDLSIEAFDYMTAIRDWKISYVVIRNVESIPRFAEDPIFMVAFKNSEITIFKVNNNFEWER